MPDKEKILRGAECCKYEHSQNGCPEECPYLPEGRLTCGLDPLLDDVIVLLREQEPVAPTETEDGDALCGNCGETVGTEELNCGGISMVKYEYCPHCGRRVKWDG